MSVPHIKGVLDSFASHLRIRREEGDVTEIAQKYLALGCNVVPAQLIYESISSDYKWIEMKTHSPPLAVYSDQKQAPLDVETFVGIISNGYTDSVRSKTPTFLDFVDSVVLPNFMSGDPSTLERWVEASRKDKWKDAALFVGLNYKENPKFHTLLKAIVGETHDAVDVSKLYKSMIDYKPKDRKLLGQDMAKIIKSIQFKQEFVNAVDDEPTFIPNAVTPIIIREAPRVETALEFIAFRVGIVDDIESLRTPVMEAYRKRAGLGAVVDTKRIAQQMVAASLVEKRQVDTLPNGLLTRSQARLEPLQGPHERALVAEILQREDVFSTKTIQTALLASDYAKQIANTCNQKMWDARVLISYMTDPEKHMDERTFARWSKLDKPTSGGEDVFLGLLLSQ